MEAKELSALLQRHLSMPLAETALALLPGDVRLRISGRKNIKIDSVLSLFQIEGRTRAKGNSPERSAAAQFLEAERASGRDSVDVIILSTPQLTFDIFVANESAPYERIVAIDRRPDPMETNIGEKPNAELFRYLDARMSVLEPEILRFCEEHGFVMRSNSCSEPCRVLHKRDQNPSWMIGIHFHGNYRGSWREIVDRDNLEVEVGASAQFTNLDGVRFSKSFGLLGFRFSAGSTYSLPYDSALKNTGKALTHVRNFLEGVQIPAELIANTVEELDGWQTFDAYRKACGHTTALDGTPY